MTVVPTVLAVLLMTTSGGDPLAAPFEDATAPVQGTPTADEEVAPAVAPAAEDPARVAMLRARKRAYLEAKLDAARVLAEEKQLEAAGLIAGGLAIPAATVASSLGVAMTGGTFGTVGPAAGPAPVLAVVLAAAGCVSTCAVSPWLVLGGMTRLNDVEAAEEQVVARERALAKHDGAQRSTAVRY